MPFYEYECRRCATKFEAMLAMSTRDAAEKELECPECGAQDSRRLISNFAPISSAPAAPGGLPCGADTPCAGGT